MQRLVLDIRISTCLGTIIDYRGVRYAPLYNLWYYTVRNVNNDEVNDIKLKYMYTYNYNRSA